MDDLRIRRATADAIERGSTSPRSRTHEDDAEALAETYRSAYRENRELGFPAKAESATAEEVARWIRDHRVFVAEANEERTDEASEGEIVGGVRLEVTDDDRVKLSRLGIREGWKGEGVGSRLLDRAEEAVRGWGHGTVWLTTPEDHPFLPDFYRNRGYEVTGEYPLEYRDYDEVVMEKRVG